MGSTDRPALEAHEVVKRYGDTLALEGVSLTVPTGACVALVGESGSGKTTLLRCFNRMVEPDAGTVRWQGDDVAGLDPVRLRRRIGYVQQEGGLLPHWRVQRNVALVPWLNRRVDVAARSTRALELVGLTAAQFGERWPAQLSGGQRQRVALARALADRPSLVLLDEPFGALDAITRGELHETFQQLRRDLQLTAVLVTHDLQEAFLLADFIAVLHHGRVEQVARPDELARAPATPYAARLISRAGVGAS